MPELPDITVYVEALGRRVLGKPLRAVRLGSPFLLRTVDPPLAEYAGLPVLEVRRLGKRIVLAFEGERFLALHLMILGRLAWKKAGAKVGGRAALAAFDFDEGTLLFTESGGKHRASLHAARGEAALLELSAGGIEPLTASVAAFRAAITDENHTLKRTLTDPRILSGIGNAYSDEILHRAKLSPVLLTQKMTDEDVRRLHAATREVLAEWTDRLREEAGDGWPTKVTAFREGMAVHGRYGLPCPACGSLVLRIVKGESEANYCATCQTGGKVLADRALSKLLHGDWPKTVDEWERRIGPSAERASRK